MPSFFLLLFLVFFLDIFFFDNFTASLLSSSRSRSAAPRLLCTQARTPHAVLVSSHGRLLYALSLSESRSGLGSNSPLFRALGRGEGGGAYHELTNPGKPETVGEGRDVLFFLGAVLQGWCCFLGLNQEGWLTVHQQFAGAKDALRRATLLRRASLSLSLPLELTLSLLLVNGSWKRGGGHHRTTAMVKSYDGSYRKTPRRFAAAAQLAEGKQEAAKAGARRRSILHSTPSCSDEKEASSAARAASPRSGNCLAVCPACMRFVFFYIS